MLGEQLLCWVLGRADMILVGQTNCSASAQKDGMHCGALTHDEEQLQMAIWAMSSAPLLMSTVSSALPRVYSCLRTGVQSPHRSTPPHSKPTHTHKTFEARKESRAKPQSRVATSDRNTDLGSQDVAAIPAESKKILLNKGVLAINQDPLGRMPFRYFLDVRASVVPLPRSYRWEPERVHRSAGALILELKSAFKKSNPK